MTGDERAAALFTKQGFLIMACDEPCEIGEIQPPLNHFGCTTPIRIIGAATFAEYDAQNAVANQIDPTAGTALHEPRLRYFYRIEAAD